MVRQTVRCVVGEGFLEISVYGPDVRSSDADDDLDALGIVWWSKKLCAAMSGGDAVKQANKLARLAGENGEIRRFCRCLRLGAKSKGQRKVQAEAAQPHRASSSHTRKLLAHCMVAPWGFYYFRGARHLPNAAGSHALPWGPMARGD